MELEVLQNVLASPSSELQFEFRSFLPVVLNLLGLLLVQGWLSLGKNGIFPWCTV